MSAPDDSGPVFPILDISKTQWVGMSLRDWFAGQYLAGLGAWESCPWNEGQVAQASYSMADAMLKARKGKGEA